MFGGVDKVRALFYGFIACVLIDYMCLQYGGVVVAPSGGTEAGACLEDVIASATAEETVIVPMDATPDATDDNPTPAPVTVNVMLEAKLNTDGGGILWQQVGSP